MPESMKEKLAQIIAEGRVGYMGGAPEERDFATVDAILATLLKPTDEMFQASFMGRNPSWLVWQAMLKAAGEE